MNNSESSENTDAQILLNKVVHEFISEQRHRRRWRWIYRLIFILLIGFIIYQLSDYSEESSGGATPHAGIIDLFGAITDTDQASSDNFAKGMDAAYKNSGLKAVVIRINSPGGSPVQADYIYNTINFYRNRYKNIKVYAVCVDMCASAAYYVAAAATEIYANPSSMVGSIGVIYKSFGFVDALSKVGVSRRLQTAGNNKGFLDPFLPETQEQKDYLQLMLDGVHGQFIERVKRGRGSRLKIDDNTFSGRIWTGSEARDRGLIDGFASAGQLMRDTLKLEKAVDYTYKQSVLERVSKNIGTAAANQLPIALGLKPGLE